MATIEKRDNRYRVRIRNRGNDYCRTFDDEETATLWARWKEDLIEKMKAFDREDRELVTLEDAITFKVRSLEENGNSKRDTEALLYLKNVFSGLLGLSLKEITYDMLCKEADRIMNTKVTKGGKGDGLSGVSRLPSEATVLKRFVLLATVYSNLIENGVHVVNEAQAVVSYLRTKFAASKS